MEAGPKSMGSNNTPPIKNKVKFTLQTFDVSYLTELLSKVPQDTKDQFARDYGRLADLLLIPVDANALEAMGAMVKYWNPELRIFEFPNVDASPTIEEYDVLLDIPLVSRLKVYLFTGTQNVSEDLIEELICTRPSASDIIKQGPYYGLKWSFLKKHLARVVEKEDWDAFKPALALAVYGMVLFPFVNDMIDQCAIDVLAKFQRFGANPVPAILADTLLSFQRSLEKGIPKVRCCTQLLYVWMMTMFKHHRYPDWTRYSLRRFRKTVVQPMHLSDWEALFDEVTPKNFGTKCRLYDLHDEVMYSCGNYPNMVLMGPRGCISVSPALVLGQMKWGMLPVSPEQLQGFVIYYKDQEATKEVLDDVRNALKNIRILGKKELGERQAFYTEEYKIWRNERRQGKMVPSVPLPYASTGPSEVELLRGQLKVMEAKLEESRWRNEKDSFAIEKLNKVVLGMKEEEASLKRDYAEMCSNSGKFHLTRSVEEMSAQIVDFKDRLKAQGRVINAANADKRGLENEVQRLQAALFESQQNEQEAWSQVKGYQSALDGSMAKEARLKAMLDETENLYQEVVAEADMREEQFSRQLWELQRARDEAIAGQEEWSENWREIVQTSRDERDQWETKCRGIVDGLGDFADEWLRTFQEAKVEMTIYPESELLPSMKNFYELSRDVARDLKKWRDVVNREC